jgi:hypothetical protein
VGQVTQAVNVCKTSGGEREGKRPLGKPRSRWEVNIIIYLIGIGCVDMDCIGLKVEPVAR